MHVIAAKAVAFKEALAPEFKGYQQKVLDNARLLAKKMMERGYDVVSKGTDNHLFLLDLTKQDLTGKAVDAALGQANITVNKNAVPNDQRSPFVTSGIRIGTPAITTRGFEAPQIHQLSDWICGILDARLAEAKIQTVKHEVLQLCAQFPVYQDTR